MRQILKKGEFDTVYMKGIVRVTGLISRYFGLCKDGKYYSTTHLASGYGLGYSRRQSHAKAKIFALEALDVAWNDIKVDTLRYHPLLDRILEIARKRDF